MIKHCRHRFSSVPGEWVSSACAESLEQRIEHLTKKCKNLEALATEQSKDHKEFIILSETSYNSLHRHTCTKAEAQALTREKFKQEGEKHFLLRVIYAPER